MPTDTAAVTGGTGFIGTHLVHRLVRTGVRVRALVRRRTGRPDPPFPFPVSPDEVDVVWGDITDPDAVAAAVAGASVVYHLAGHARAWSREERRSQAVNGGGTEHVCRAAARHGARLVHVSTNLVEGVEDTDDPRTALTAYQRSKLQGEAAVRRFVASGAHAVILRPTRVFGPGLLSQANSATLVIELYRRGRFRLRIADGDARANYVFVDDVVAGLLRSAEPGTGEDAGACYTLGGENATMEQFLAAVAAATGRRRAVVALPRAAVRLVAAAAEGLGLLGIEPFITRDWAELLSRDWPADSRRAEASLGYRPRPLSEGVTQTVRWLEAGRPSPYSPRN